MGRGRRGRCMGGVAWVCASGASGVCIGCVHRVCASGVCIGHVINVSDGCRGAASALFRGSGHLYRANSERAPLTHRRLLRRPLRLPRRDSSVHQRLGCSIKRPLSHHFRIDEGLPGEDRLIRRPLRLPSRDHLVNQRLGLGIKRPRLSSTGACCTPRGLNLRRHRPRLPPACCRAQPSLVICPTAAHQRIRPHPRRLLVSRVRQQRRRGIRLDLNRVEVR